MALSFLIWTSIAVLAYYFWIVVSTRASIRIPIEDLPAVKYALVLGAGLRNDGAATDILADRVISAVELVNAGKAESLILSGTVRSEVYNEPLAMQRVAAASGVSGSSLILDTSGISTLDSLVNFQQKHFDHPLIVVTQSFHLPRSLWLARKLSLTAFGYAANQYHFSIGKRFFWQTREILALPFNTVKILARVLKKRIGNI